MLTSLVPPTVAVVETRRAVAAPPLLAEEQFFVQHASAGRRREFAAGRACARVALRRLGYPDQVIPADEYRAPVWPDGVVGSITHCAGFTAAAVARHTDLTMLGIDAEPAGSLDDDVGGEVASDEEHGRANDELGVEAGLVLFCAKEAVYKAWFPVTRRWLGFDAVSLSVNRSGTFEVEPRGQLAADDRALLSALRGRFAITPRFVLTAVYGE